MPLESGSGPPPGTGSSAIADRTKAALLSFNNVLDKISEQDDPQDAIDDNLSRFRIWAGNIGAYHVDSKSADYRVRDAPEIAQRIIELLDELIETNDDITSILSGEREDAALIESAGYDDPSGRDDEGQTEVSELCLAAVDIISSLLKVSGLIRKATGRDRYAKAAASKDVPFLEVFDLGHVAEKFPKLQQHPWLIERLGKANIQRRQYLRYARKHHERIAHEPTDFSRSAAAPSRFEEKLGLPDSHPKTVVSSRPTLAHTDASTLIVDLLPPMEPTYVEDLDDAMSQATSLVTSKAGHGKDGELDVIRLSELSKDGEPFECPYCWAIVQTKRQRSWRKHVLRDIRAWACTFEHCNCGLFEDRDTWFQHELDAHRRLWSCQSCPDAVFPSAAAMSIHLRRKHGGQPGEALTAIVDASSRPMTEVPASACPLCNEWESQLRSKATELGIKPDDALVAPLEDFRRHLSSHLEQLALFSIPPSLERLMESDSHHGDHGQSSINANAEAMQHWRDEAEQAADPNDVNLEPADDILTDVIADSVPVEQSVERTADAPDAKLLSSLTTEEKNKLLTLSAEHANWADLFSPDDIKSKPTNVREPLNELRTAYLFQDFHAPSTKDDEMARLKELGPLELDSGKTFCVRNNESSKKLLDSLDYRPRQPSSLEEYQLQLVLLEQENKNRLMQSRQKPGSSGPATVPEIQMTSLDPSQESVRLPKSTVGQGQKSVEELERIVLSNKSSLDEHDADRLQRETELAESYRLNERYQEAIELLEDVVDRRRLRLPGSAHDLVDAEISLADVYFSHGRQEEGIRVLWRSVNDAPRRGDGPLLRLTLMRRLVDACLLNGQNEEAIEVLEQMYLIQEKIAGPADRQRLSTQGDLARTYNNTGKPKEVIRLLENVIPVQQDLLGPKDYRILKFKYELARAYSATRKFSKAIELLEMVYPLQVENEGHDGVHVRASKHELARAYLRTGQQNETQAAVTLLEEILDKENHKTATLDQQVVDFNLRYDLARAYSANGQSVQAEAMREEIARAEEAMAEAPVLTSSQTSETVLDSRTAWTDSEDDDPRPQAQLHGTDALKSADESTFKAKIKGKTFEGKYAKGTKNNVVAMRVIQNTGLLDQLAVKDPDDDVAFQKPNGGLIQPKHMINLMWQDEADIWYLQQFFVVDDDDLPCDLVVGERARGYHAANSSSMERLTKQFEETLTSAPFGHGQMPEREPNVPLSEQTNVGDRDLEILTQKASREEPRNVGGARTSSDDTHTIRVRDAGTGWYETTSPQGLDLPSVPSREHEPLSPNPIDGSDPVAVKRAKATAAARLSRARKVQEREELESNVTDLKAEVEYWKQRALRTGDQESSNADRRQEIGDDGQTQIFEKREVVQNELGRDVAEQQDFDSDDDGEERSIPSAVKPGGILKKPTETFPEDPNPLREGVAPLKDAAQEGIPPGARWTKIDRRLVNPEALEEALERFEERLDSVIVLRVLTKEEIQKLADRTLEIRDARDPERPLTPRNDDTTSAHLIQRSLRYAVQGDPPDVVWSSRAIRYQVALEMATEVLDPVSRSWMSSRLGIHDILFSNDHTVSIQADTSFIRLAIILLELLFGRFLEDDPRWQEPSFPGKVDDSFSRRAVATMWLEEAASEGGEEYADAVRWCLDDPRPSLEDENWRTEFREKVVQPLSRVCDFINP